MPIKFAGVGEKMNQLEVFHPEQIASRILGMGDVLSLIEKAEADIDPSKASISLKTAESHFNLNDFLEQMWEMKKLGPLNRFWACSRGQRQTTQRYSGQSRKT